MAKRACGRGKGSKLEAALWMLLAGVRKTPGPDVPDSPDFRLVDLVPSRVLLTDS